MKKAIGIVILEIMMASGMWAYSYTPLFHIAMNNEEEKKVVHVSGEYSLAFMTSDVTGRQAVREARLDARRKAVEQAFGSRILVQESLRSSSAGESYNSYALNVIDGDILSFEIIDEGFKISEVKDDEVIVYCNARVEVKKGLSYDLDFYAEVNDVENYYYESSPIDFEIKTSKDCYLTIFCMDEESNVGVKIYPKKSESKKLKKQESYDLKRISRNTPIYAGKLPSGETKAVNTIVFVFTKNRQPFNIIEPSVDDIMQWLAKIPNNEKFAEFKPFEVIKK